MIARTTLLTLLRRPAALGVLSALALAGLTSGGLVVAGAVSGDPVADSSSLSTDGGNGDDNVAVAVNRTDGRDVYAVRLKVVMTDASTVDAGNAAVAAASCTDCRTVAVAIEGVLLSGNPEVVAPQNVALAINQGCSGCETLAAAYQTVLSTGGRVRMTGAGRATVAQLRRQLNTLRTQDLEFSAMAAEIDRIASAFAQVLRTEVVPIGPQPAASASATPYDTPSPASTSASPEPTETASSEPSPAPSDGSPSVEPSVPSDSPSPIG
jgi:putative peptide zinc metalloprotease protein